VGPGSGTLLWDYLRTTLHQWAMTNGMFLPFHHSRIYTDLFFVCLLVCRIQIILSSSLVGWFDKLLTGNCSYPGHQPGMTSGSILILSCKGKYPYRRCTCFCNYRLSRPCNDIPFHQDCCRTSFNGTRNSWHWCTRLLGGLKLLHPTQALECHYHYWWYH